MQMEWERKSSQRSSKRMAPVFLTKVEEISYGESKGDEDKQKFKWSGEILEYLVKGMGKEVGKGQEEYCQTHEWPSYGVWPSQ